MEDRNNYTIRVTRNTIYRGVYKSTVVTGNLEKLVGYFQTNLIAGHSVKERIPIYPKSIKSLVDSLNDYAEIYGNKFSYELITEDEPIKNTEVHDKIDVENDLLTFANLVSTNIIHCVKEVLTSDEAARYMGISKSYLYKLTMSGKIPHYKPMGKMCYFNRAELEQWLQQNRDDELTL